MIDVQYLGQQLMLADDHIADAELLELHAWLCLAVGRRSRNSIAQCIHQDDVILRAVHDLARTNQFDQLRRGSSKPGWEQYGVGLVRVELPEGAVAEAAVADGLAAFQLEVTQRRKLLLTVLREGGKMKYKRQQKQSEKFHGRELYAMTVARQQ